MSRADGSWNLRRCVGVAATEKGVQGRLPFLLSFGVVGIIQGLGPTLNHHQGLHLKLLFDREGQKLVGCLAVGKIAGGRVLKNKKGKQK